MPCRWAGTFTAAAPWSVAYSTGPTPPLALAGPPVDIPLALTGAASWAAAVDTLLRLQFLELCAGNFPRLEGRSHAAAVEVAGWEPAGCAADLMRQTAAAAGGDEGDDDEDAGAEGDAEGVAAGQKKKKKKKKKAGAIDLIATLLSVIGAACSFSAIIGGGEVPSKEKKCICFEGGEPEEEVQEGAEDAKGCGGGQSWGTLWWANVKLPRNH